MNKQILLIEDDQLILKAVEMRLIRSGFDVRACKDGRAAMDLIDEFKPDMILTDLMLPFVSGLELLSAYKKKYPEMPVIVFSTLGQEPVVEEAFMLGADDFITKPFSLNEVVLRANKLFSHQEAKHK